MDAPFVYGKVYLQYGSCLSEDLASFLFYA